MLILVLVNLFTLYVNGHPLNYAHSPDIYNSLTPNQRYQRSFPGFYNNNGMFQQNGPLYHHPAMEMNRPIFRRNAYESTGGFRHQYEQPSQTGMYGPPSQQQHRPIGRDESQLIVLPRGADEEYAMYPLKTKMIDGFDEEDQDMIHEEEMGDALSYIDSQTPTRYTSERIMKPPKPSIPSLQMEMAPPRSPMGSQRYNMPQSHGQRMPEMMLPHPEDYQHNYEVSRYGSENNMYPQSPAHHHQQKRYQPHYQYYQNPRYHQFENQHHFFETPNEDIMYSPNSNMYTHTSVDSAPEEVILVADDEEFDDDENIPENESIIVMNDSAVMVEENNSIDNVSSGNIEDEDEDEIITADSKIVEKITVVQETTEQPEQDNVDEQYIDEENATDEDILQSVEN